MITVALLGLRRLVAAVPVGVPTATVAAVAVLGAGLSEYRLVVPALAAVVAVAVAEVLGGRLLAGPRGWLVLGGGLPVVAWAGQLAGLAVTAGVGWSPALWTGVVVLTGLVGLVLAALTQPSDHPAL